MIFILSTIFLLNFNHVSSQDWCDKTFSATSGTIDAYNVTSSHSSCTYTIRVQSSRKMWLRLNWKIFDVDGKMPHCYRDNVQVSVGCGSSRRNMVEFCSGKMFMLPHSIVSPDNCMQIRYNRRNYGTKGGGFVASYQAYEMNRSVVRTPCNSYGSTYLKLPALIVSQGWPNPSGYHSTNQRCKWKIQTRDKGQKIMMTMMDLNGYKKRSWPCSSDRSILKIEGKKSITTKTRKYWRYCSYYSNDESSGSTSTEYYEMEINLRQFASFNTGRGFAIGFVSYEDEYAKSLSSWSSIIGTVAVVLIAVVVAFCCFRRYRRRQMMENQPMLGQGVVVQPPQQYEQPQPPPSAYPQATIPAAYPDQAPPPYQPPPYPGQGVPSAYPNYPPPGGPPPQGYPGYPQQAAAPYPQQAPAPYPTAYPSAYPPPYPDQNAPPK